MTSKFFFTMGYQDDWSGRLGDRNLVHKLKLNLKSQIREIMGNLLHRGFAEPEELAKEIGITDPEERGCLNCLTNEFDDGPGATGHEIVDAVNVILKSLKLHGDHAGAQLAICSISDLQDPFCTPSGDLWYNSQTGKVCKIQTSGLQEGLTKTIEPFRLKAVSGALGVEVPIIVGFQWACEEQGQGPATVMTDSGPDEPEKEKPIIV